jgi:DNA invertase Pin-like site-specific DNA recombinase
MIGVCCRFGVRKQFASACIATLAVALSTMHGELMITILAGLAPFERHLIKARTDEGRKREHVRGVRVGRPFKLSRFQFRLLIAPCSLCWIRCRGP